MKLTEIKIRISDADSTTVELLPYRLGDLGYEGFLENEGEISAYIYSANYDHHALISLLKEFNIPESGIEEIPVPEKNWNEEWEKNFEPVGIEGICYIRAPFHLPDTLYPHEIVIEPKMSFGTGHHATTSLMMAAMPALDLKNKTVLDAGCGTGILSIFAEKLGAASVTAIDIDEWSYRNATENVLLNRCSSVKVLLGDISGKHELPGQSNLSDYRYDCILANINLNVLMASLETYSRLCIAGGHLLMSGILTSDIPALKNETEKHHFTFEFSKSLNNWALIRFRKK